ncbi:MAG TPA: site-2 protease family protein [Crinalium sp.]|jgi:Zn-dependent protease
MKTGWRIGSLFGIPLLLDTSWFSILALVTFLYGGVVWQSENWGPVVPWLAGFAMALLLFGSVLLHELGHSLVARSQGITVNSITLFLFGGIASIDQESKTPGQAFQVAIAGPAVSFILFLVLWPLSSVLAFSAPSAAIIRELAHINLVLAIFNMIPGLPLDGGQVLKAAVWKVTGSRLKGVRWAARIGQALGWTAIILGITAFITSTSLGFLWIVLLGWFGVRNATAYTRVTDLQEALLQLNAASAMTHDYRVVDAELTVSQFTDKYLLQEEGLTPVFYAASDGRYRGMIAVDELSNMERSEWDRKTLKTLVDPLTDIPSVVESTPLTRVIETLENEQLRRITVLSPAGAVAGVIDRGDIVRSVAEKLKIPVPEALIKRIKEEGAYPPGLQLQALAKSVSDL